MSLLKGKVTLRKAVFQLRLPITSEDKIKEFYTYLNYKSPKDSYEFRAISESEIQINEKFSFMRKGAVFPCDVVIKAEPGINSMETTFTIKLTGGIMKWMMWYFIFGYIGLFIFFTISNSPRTPPLLITFVVFSTLLSFGIFYLNTFIKINKRMAELRNNIRMFIPFSSTY